jgi:hypothetical protein
MLVSARGAAHSGWKRSPHSVDTSQAPGAAPPPFAAVGMLVSPDYFQTIGIGLLQGQVFTTGTASSLSCRNHPNHPTVAAARTL